MPPHPTVLRPDGRLADHYIDVNGALDKVRDGASPGAVNAAAIDGLGVVPPRFDVAPLSSAEPPRQKSDA